MFFKRKHNALINKQKQRMPHTDQNDGYIKAKNMRANQ